MSDNCDEQIKESGITDVVNDFDYSTQSDEYNKHFIAWRRRKNNPYAFNYISNERENTFVYGQGLVSETAAENEHKILSNVLSVVGAALLTGAFIDFIFKFIVVEMLENFGINIHNSFTGSVIYGDKVPVILVLLLNDVFKLLLPLIIVSRKFLLPKQISRPMRINNPTELLASISVILMVGAFISKFDMYSEKSRAVYSFFESSSTKTDFWKDPFFILWVIGDVVIVSAIREFLRMKVFTVLRQFGDVFALLFSSIMTGVLTGNLNLMIGMSVVSIITTVGAIRSGSIMTAIITRIVYRTFFVVLTLMSYNKSIWVRGYFTFAVFMAGLVIFTIVVLSSKKFRRKKIFATYRGYLSTKNRTLTVVENFPIIAAIICCVLNGILQYFK